MVPLTWKKAQGQCGAGGSLQSEAGVQGAQGYSGYRLISTDAVDDCILWLSVIASQILGRY